MSMSDEEFEMTYQMMRPKPPHQALQPTEPIAKMLVKGKEIKSNCELCLARLVASREERLNETEDYFNQQRVEVAENDDERRRIKGQIKAFEKQFAHFRINAAILQKFDSIDTKFEKVAQRFSEIVDPHNDAYESYSERDKKLDELKEECATDTDKAEKIREEYISTCENLNEKFEIVNEKIDEFKEKRETFNDRHDAFLGLLQRKEKTKGDLFIRDEYLQNQLTMEHEEHREHELKKIKIDEEIDDFEVLKEKNCREVKEIADLIDGPHRRTRDETELKYLNTKLTSNEGSEQLDIQRTELEFQETAAKESHEVIVKLRGSVDDLTEETKDVRKKITKGRGKRGELKSVIDLLREEKERKLAKMQGQLQIFEEAIALEFSDNSSEIISVPMYESPMQPTMLNKSGFKTPTAPRTSQPAPLPKPLVAKAVPIAEKKTATVDPYAITDASPLPSFRSFMAGKGKRK